MPKSKPSILIVEDDPDVAEMLHAYFERRGYTIVAVHWGEDAVTACNAKRPDLVILDIRLPDIDGFEVARRLRENRRMARVPIIFLTEKRARQDRLRGFELGADDYITKPFDIQELRLRVRNALERSQPGSAANMITSMATGSIVDDRLQECLKCDQWAVLVISIHHLEQFRETYGFVAADDVLRAVGLMVQNAVRDVGLPGDFIGHLSDTDFVVVTTPERLPGIHNRLETRLGQSVEYFYPLDDRLDKKYTQDGIWVEFREVSSLEMVFPSLATLKRALAKQGSE